MGGGRCPHARDIITGYEPETKQLSAVWVFPDDNPPLEFNRSRSVPKRMIAFFFAKSDHVAIIPVENRKAVTPDWYINHARHGANGFPERVSVTVYSMTMQGGEGVGGVFETLE